MYNWLGRYFLPIPAIICLTYPFRVAAGTVKPRIDPLAASIFSVTCGLFMSLACIIAWVSHRHEKAKK